MGLEYQNKIKEMAEQYGAENLVVVLGFLGLFLVAIYAITLFFGDVSLAGPLSGVELRLPVYHILEPEVRALIPKDVFKAQMLAEDVEDELFEEILNEKFDIDEITQMLKEIRALDSSRVLEYLEQLEEKLED